MTNRDPSCIDKHMKHLTLFLPLLVSACAVGVLGSPLPNPLCPTPNNTYKVSFEENSGDCGFFPDATFMIRADGLAGGDNCESATINGCSQSFDNCSATIATDDTCTSSTQFTFSSDGSVGSGVEHITCGNCSSIYSLFLTQE